MPKKLSRRRLFAYGALCGAALAGAYTAGWWWFKARRGDTQDLIVSILRRHLKGLPIAEEDMLQFAVALQPRFAEHLRFAQLGMFGPLYDRFDVIQLLPGQAESFRRYEDLIVGEFLLSSDFFDPQRKSLEAVQFFGARELQRRICGNPFANFEEP